MNKQKATGYSANVPRHRLTPKWMAGWFIRNPRAFMKNAQREGVWGHLSRPIIKRSSRLDATIIEPVCAISPIPSIRSDGPRLVWTRTNLDRCFMDPRLEACLLLPAGIRQHADPAHDGAMTYHGPNPPKCPRLQFAAHYPRKQYGNHKGKVLTGGNDVQRPAHGGFVVHSGVELRWEISKHRPHHQDRLASTSPATKWSSQTSL
jgi:hypothetical protein